MTKQQIKDNNDIVLGILDDFNGLWDNVPHGRVVKFRNCNARTQSARLGESADMSILISYETPVAAVYRDKLAKRCICIDVLRYVYGYTATSAQHINKFFHDFVDGYARRYDCEVINYRYETVKG